MAPWRLLCAATLSFAILLPGGMLASNRVRQDRAPRITREDALAAYAKLPTAFFPSGKGFQGRGPDFDIQLDKAGVLLALDRGAGRRPAQLRMTLLGAATSRPAPESRLPGVRNEYIGEQPSRWRERVPTFARVRYPSVYPGIDALYYGNAGTLEYDFQVRPGADPRSIQMGLGGARRVRVADNGDLVVRLRGGTVRQRRPRAYQTTDGRRIPVSARYVIRDGRVGFGLGRYDRSRELIIDPVLSYATYLGGNNYDVVTSVAVGSDGSVLLAGGTRSSSLPGYGGTRTYTNEDAFVTKLAPDGASITYTTVLGGNTATSGYTDAYADDRVNDIMLSGTTAVVVGDTKSNFPTQSTYPADLVGSCASAGQNGFLAFVTTSGSLAYSSCFGGASDDSAQSVAQRYAGGINKTTYTAIAGWTSSDSWGTGAVAGYQSSRGGAKDGYLMQVGSNNSGCDIDANSPCIFVHYKTYIGGSSDDWAYGLAYDTSGYAVVAGETASSAFPVSSGSALGGRDAWVARFGVSSNTNVRSYSVLFGGSSDDAARDIALDSSNNSYIVGSTASSTLPSAATSGNLVRGGGTDGFIAKLNSSGTVQNSVFAGGTSDDSLGKIAIQQNGSAVAEYAVGTTASGPSASFSPRNTVAGHSCSDGNTQAFVVKRIEGATPEGAVIACLGGSDPDGDFGTAVAVPAANTDGTIYVAGYTGGGFSGAGGVQPNYAGSTYDGFLAKLSQTPATITSGPAEGEVVGAGTVSFGLAAADAGLGFTCSAPVSGLLVAGTRGTADCPGTTASYSALADGLQTFEVASVDAFGSVSAVTARAFTVDTQPPAAIDLVSPGEGEVVNGGFPTIRWTESSDAHGVTYSVLVDGKRVETAAAPTCTGGICSAQVRDPVVAGQRTLAVSAADGATPPNTTTSATRNVTISDPPNPQFTIAPNPALAGSKVTFDATASNDASHTVTEYRWDLDGDGTFETSTTSPVVTHVYATPGTFTIGLQVTDSANQTSTRTQSLKVNAPAGAGGFVGVSINNGDQYTNSPQVTLNIVAPPSATALLISNDGGFVGSLPQPVEKSVSWSLRSSGPERLPKTVYVRFLTGTFASPNFTDDIILDERPPIVDSAALAAGATGAVASRLRSFKVKVRAHDTNSGVAGVQVTAVKRKPGKLLAYKKTLKVKLSAKPRFIRARDKAGNYSRWKTLR